MNSFDVALKELKNDLYTNKEIASFLLLREEIAALPKLSKQIRKMYYYQNKMHKDKNNKFLFRYYKYQFFKVKSSLDNNPLINNLNNYYEESISLLNSVKEMII